MKKKKKKKRSRDDHANKSKETRVGMKDGIVGWIYRTKVDPISILHSYPYFFTFLSNGHPFFSFHGNVFSLTYSWSFFSSLFMVLCMYT